MINLNEHVSVSYAALLVHIMDKGALKIGRNGTTHEVVGVSLTHDMFSSGFPIITNRHIYFKPALGEFCSFMHGATRNATFVENGCNFWTKNLAAEYWQRYLDEHSLNPDYLGQIYGAQWRTWLGGLDQWSMVKNLLLEDKRTRRACITSYNPADLKRSCLPPCHMMYQFIKNEIGMLDIIVTQRSLDVVIGLPYDWVLFGLMLMSMAFEVDLLPGRIHINVGSAHIYDTHLAAVQEILSEPVSERIISILEDYRQDPYTIDRYELLNYPDDLRRIKVEMVA